jgi:hypothetical protein
MKTQIKNNCEYCFSEYLHLQSQKSKYCSSTCRNKAYIQRNVKGEENIDYIICKICNFKFKEINADHLNTHNINKEEYDVKYGNRISEKTRFNKNTLSSLLTPEFSKKLSESHSIENYKKKYGQDLGVVKYNEMILNKSYKNSINYYHDKYGKQVGEKLFKERQLKGSMTLNNQIKLHGNAEGTRRYHEWLMKQKNKNTISYFVELYGYELGLSKWFDKNNKISIANSKINNDQKKEYKKYCILVDKFTRISLQIYNLENIHLRGLTNGYDLDHRVSKIFGFKNEIIPEVVAHISNLQIITSSENRIKQHNSNINVSEILENYKKDDNYKDIIKQIKMGFN